VVAVQNPSKADIKKCGCKNHNIYLGEYKYMRRKICA